MVAVEVTRGELLSGPGNMEWRPVRAMAGTLRRYAVVLLMVCYFMARKCYDVFPPFYRIRSNVPN